MGTSQMPEASRQPEYPRYSYPAYIMFSLARSALRGQARSFEEDARACVAELRPPLRIRGAEIISRIERYVITVNHYYHRGFRSAWTALDLRGDFRMRA